MRPFTFDCKLATTLLVTKQTIRTLMPKLDKQTSAVTDFN